MSSPATPMRPSGSGGAPASAALLLPQIFPISSVVTPCSTRPTRPPGGPSCRWPGRDGGRWSPSRAEGPRSLSEYSAGPRAWGLRFADKERGGERCGSIADDERRRMGPQSPCALRVPAAWGRLLRCRASSMLRHRTSSRRLASGPTASGTRPGPILGQAPSGPARRPRLPRPRDGRPRTRPPCSSAA